MGIAAQGSFFRHERRGECPSTHPEPPCGTLQQSKASRSDSDLVEALHFKAADDRLEAGERQSGCDGGAHDSERNRCTSGIGPPALGQPG